MKSTLILIHYLQICFVVSDPCAWSLWSTVPQCYRQAHQCVKAFSRSCICNLKTYSPSSCPGRHLKPYDRFYLFLRLCDRPCQNTQNWCSWEKWSSWSEDCDRSTRTRIRGCCNSPGSNTYDYGCLAEVNNISNIETAYRTMKCSNSFWRIAAPLIGITILIILGIFILIVRRDRRRYFSNVPNVSYGDNMNENVQIPDYPVCEPSAPSIIHSNEISVSNLNDPPPTYESLFPPKPEQL